MIIFITLCVLTALCVLGFFLGKKVKKLAGKIHWGFAIAGAVFFVVTCFNGYSNFSNYKINNENIYMAAKYFADGNYEIAKIKLNYLKNEKNSGFNENIIRSMIYDQSNEKTNAKMLLNLCDSNSKKNKEKQTLVNYIKENDLSVPENRKKAVNYLLNIVINDVPQQWERRYAIESTTLMGQIVPEKELEIYSETFGKNDGEYLEAACYLINGDTNNAFSVAKELLGRCDSKKNRLLFAEIIAQLYYDGDLLNSEDFAVDAKTTDGEVIRLQKRYDKLTMQLTKLEDKIGLELDKEKSKKLVDQFDKISLKQNEVKNKIDKIYLYRAMNSLVGCQGIQPDILTAKLYFAAGESEKAVETIKNITENKSNLIGNDSVQGSMKRVATAFSGAEIPSVQASLVTDIENILMSTTPEITGAATLSITKELAQALVAEIKYNSNALRITTVDTSKFPQIDVMVTGSDKIMKSIVEKKEILSKDTRHKVEYTVEETNKNTEDISVCFVVDESGSMLGEPIENARNALLETAKNRKENVEMSIVGYWLDSRLACSSTKDFSALKKGIETLKSDGGTDIAAGLMGGLDELKGKKGRQFIILMTDGQNDLSKEMIDVLDDANSRGVVIYTIGFGDQNDELLSTIASQTGGEYIKAEDSSELGNIYDLLQIYINNALKISYTVTENADVKDRYIYLREKNSDCSTRYEYVLPTEEKAKPIATLSNVYPQLINCNAAKDGVNLMVRGDGLENVISLTINGNVANIDEKETEHIDCSLDIELPTGIYSMELSLSDGTKIYNPFAFAVGEEIDRYTEFGIGNLNIMGSIILLNETTIAIENATINHDIKAENLLVLELPLPIDIENFVAGQYLGDSGILRGCTDIYVRARNYNDIDLAYSGTFEQILLATGEFEGTVGKESTAIAMKNGQEAIIEK